MDGATYFGEKTIIHVGHFGHMILMCMQIVLKNSFDLDNIGDFGIFFQETSSIYNKSLQLFTQTISSISFGITQ